MALLRTIIITVGHEAILPADAVGILSRVDRSAEVVICLLMDDGLLGLMIQDGQIVNVVAKITIMPGHHELSLLTVVA